MLTAQRRLLPKLLTGLSLSVCVCRTILSLYLAQGSAETQTDTFQLVLCTSCRQNNKLPTSEDVRGDAYCALKDLCPGLFEVLLQSQ